MEEFKNPWRNWRIFSGIHIVEPKKSGMMKINNSTCLTDNPDYNLVI
jgi:hypothetical protein